MPTPTWRSRLGNQLALPDPDRPVAFARRLFESGAIRDRDVSAAVRDQARLLQDSHRHCHARPANSQHLGEEFLGQIKAVAANPVLRHEQPPRATLLDDMKSVAGGGLRYRLEGELAVAMQQAPEVRELPRQIAEITGGESERRPRDLAAAFVFRSLDFMKNGNPRKSVVADRHRLDLVPVFHHGDERDHAVFRKMNVLELVSRLEEALFRLHLVALAALHQSSELDH